MASIWGSWPGGPSVPAVSVPPPSARSRPEPAPRRSWSRSRWRRGRRCRRRCRCAPCARPGFGSPEEGEELRRPLPGSVGRGEVDGLGAGQRLAGERAPDLGRVGATVDRDAVHVAMEMFSFGAPSTPRWRWCGCSRRTRRWCCCRWIRSCRRHPARDPGHGAGAPLDDLGQYLVGLAGDLGRDRPLALGLVAEDHVALAVLDPVDGVGAVVLAVGRQGGVGVTPSAAGSRPGRRG